MLVEVVRNLQEIRKAIENASKFSEAIKAAVKISELEKLVTFSEQLKEGISPILDLQEAIRRAFPLSNIQLPEASELLKPDYLLLSKRTVNIYVNIEIEPSEK